MGNQAKGWDLQRAFCDEFTEVVAKGATSQSRVTEGMCLDSVTTAHNKGDYWMVMAGSNMAEHPC